MHRGPLRAGEWVRLTDSKGRRHNICLEPGKSFHTNRGRIAHDDLIGREEGFTITSSSGGEYLVFRPLLAEFVVSMPRGAAVVYPKDAAQIVAMADIFPGAHVVEAGVGSGALTCSLLRAVGPTAGCRRTSGARSSPTSPARNVGQFFGAPTASHPAWQLTIGDLAEALPGVGRARRPGDPGHAGALGVPRRRRGRAAPGGMVCAYVATTTQLSPVRRDDARCTAGSPSPQPWESLVRDWHVEGLAVRPGHKMIGHTAFLVTARRMAPGEGAAAKKRRPAPGAYGADYTGPRPAASRADGLTPSARRDVASGIGWPSSESSRPSDLSYGPAARVGSQAQEVTLMSTSKASSAGPQRPTSS